MNRRQRCLQKSGDLFSFVADERRAEQNRRPFLTRENMAEEKSIGNGEPRCRANIVLIIKLRSPEQGARRPEKSVLVWIVDLPLVIVIENKFLLPPIVRLPIKMRPDQPALGQKIIEWAGMCDVIRVSGVAQGVHYQGTESQLFDRS